ncbi:Armadillo repeat-containing protein 6-like [Papilio xuthus]|uniref:Armadillo repeat-containing protein 6-like n=1 Tax=Papilio xuthus TaxID=66420 RepID=A0A194PKG2_PAPXU|nr:Armadillo repeat-containing protein 6-like [Papilio xuthus]
MVRVITQETYDDVVKENMDEFDMSPEEAIKEAIAQFEAQGVDLSNIIKDLNLNTGEEHQVSLTVKKLKELSNAAQNNDEPILEQLNILVFISECLQVIRKLTLDDDVRVEFGKAHEHARELGAELLDTLTRLLENNMKPPLVSDVMCTIACLLVRHELCAVAAERGAAALFTVLADNYDDVTVVHQATKL